MVPHGQFRIELKATSARIEDKGQRIDEQIQQTMMGQRAGFNIKSFSSLRALTFFPNLLLLD